LDLWLLDTDTDSEVVVDPSVLDDGERRRADALETPGLQQRYRLAHAALRHLLGQALGLPPRDVRIVRESCPRCGAAGGRPVLGEPTRPLHFSMSSSQHLVLLGLASAAVGVDVEAVPSLRAVSEASELLHPAEREELLAMAPEIRRATFTRLWSRKEAYLKGMGVGVAHGLVSEYLGTRPQASTPEGWTLLDVPVPPAFSATAAVRTGSHAPGVRNRT
jgi:4'-phosphopantetheinyl transferase